MASRSQPCADVKNARTDAEPSAVLRVLDLFSGIGGFSLGLERAGMKTVAFCEISAKCRHLLKHHWPEVPAYDDICTLTGERLAADGIAVDAICGGSPCQDISFAGKGAGLAGERSGLWREYARLIRELRPRYVIVENVAALLSRGLGAVLGDLAALGYHAWWDCIPASAVGAHHRRDRLWLVAYPGSVEHEGFGDAFRRAIAAELSGAALADANGAVHAGELVCGGARSQASSGESRDASEGQASHGQRLRPQLGAGGSALGDAGREGQAHDQGRGASEGFSWFRAADRTGWLGRADHYWSAEPDVGRVAHGVPARVDRLHGLGNAVVPEIPYRLGRAIIAAEASLQNAQPGKAARNASPQGNSGRTQ